MEGLESKPWKGLNMMQGQPHLDHRMEWMWLSGIPEAIQ